MQKFVLGAAFMLALALAAGAADAQGRRPGGVPPSWNGSNPPGFGVQVNRPGWGSATQPPGWSHTQNSPGWGGNGVPPGLYRQSQSGRH